MQQAVSRRLAAPLPATQAAAVDDGLPPGWYLLLAAALLFALESGLARRLSGRAAPAGEPEPASIPATAGGR